MALAVVSIAFGLHTPIGDLLAWSARDQLDRLRSGVAHASDFDFGFLRFELGHRGHAALRGLEADPPSGDAGLVLAQIAAARAAPTYWDWKNESGQAVDFDQKFARSPDYAPWPSDLRQDLEKLASSHYRLRRCRPGQSCWVFSADLDGDGSAEAIVAAPRMSGHVDLVALAHEGRAGWRAIGTLRANKTHTFPEVSALLDAIGDGRFDAVQRGYADLRIEGELYLLDIE